MTEQERQEQGPPPKHEYLQARRARYIGEWIEHHDRLSRWHEELAEEHREKAERLLDEQLKV